MAKHTVKPVASTATKGAAKTGTAKKSSSLSFLRNSSNKHLLYGPVNYIMFTAGFLVVILGFILMSGGGSDDPNVFNAEEIYSTRRITVAPILVILGFVIVAIGTLLKGKDTSEA